MKYTGQDGISEFINTFQEKVFTSKDLCKKTGISQQSTRRCLSKLIKRNEIKKTIIKGRKTIYEVIKI